MLYFVFYFFKKNCLKFLEVPFLIHKDVSYDVMLFVYGYVLMFTEFFF